MFLFVVVVLVGLSIKVTSAAITIPSSCKQSMHQYISANSPSMDDYFGASVVVENDTMVVAVPQIGSARLEVFKYNRTAGSDRWEWDQTLNANICVIDNPNAKTFSMSGLRMCGNNIFLFGHWVHNCNKTHVWFRRDSPQQRYTFQSNNAFLGEIGIAFSCQTTPSGVSRIAMGILGGYEQNAGTKFYGGRLTMWEERNAYISLLATVTYEDVGLPPQAQFGMGVVVQGDSVFVGARRTNSTYPAVGAVIQVPWQANPLTTRFVLSEPPLTFGAQGSNFGATLAATDSSVFFNGILENSGQEVGTMAIFTRNATTGKYAFAHSFSEENGRGSTTMIGLGSFALGLVTGYRVDPETKVRTTILTPRHVYLYRQNANGAWESLGFFASGDAPTDEFGGLFTGSAETHAMAFAPISGDVIVGSARRPGGYGVVYVFRCDAVRRTSVMSTSSAPSTPSTVSTSSSSELPTTSTPTSAAECEVVCARVECAQHVKGWSGNACQVYSKNAIAVERKCLAKGSTCETATVACAGSNSATDGNVVTVHTCIDTECIRSDKCIPGNVEPPKIADLCKVSRESCGSGGRVCITDGKCSDSNSTTTSVPTTDAVNTGASLSVTMWSTAAVVAAIVMVRC
jgi:hypothetical protein